MYVKDLGRCFEKLDIRFECLPTMTRGSSSKERNFLLFHATRERRDRKNVYKARENGIFLPHDTRAKRMGWSTVAVVCVCVEIPWIIEDNFAFLAFTERYNVCDDDTFIQFENCVGVA